MERNNQEQVKYLWKPLCLVLAAVLTLSWVFFGFLYSNGNVSFSALETPEQTQSENGGTIIGESVGNSLKLTSTEIAPENFAANNISPLAETAYQLTATIVPSNVINKAVDWSVAFVNPSSAWATDKIVTDYVTVTPTADGALTANVECLQAFGEQIKVVCLSRDSSDISASCVCDYLKRVEEVTPFFYAGGAVYERLDTVFFGAENESDPYKFYSISFDAVYTDGTITPEIVAESYEVGIKSEILDQSQGLNSLYKGAFTYTDVSLFSFADLHQTLFRWVGFPVSYFVVLFKPYADGKTPCVSLRVNYSVLYNDDEISSGSSVADYPCDISLLEG